MWKHLGFPCSLQPNVWCHCTYHFWPRPKMAKNNPSIILVKISFELLSNVNLLIFLLPTLEESMCYSNLCKKKMCSLWVCCRHQNLPKLVVFSLFESRDYVHVLNALMNFKTRLLVNMLVYIWNRRWIHLTSTTLVLSRYCVLML